MKFYIGTIIKDDDSDYGITFQDFPGCVAVGKTPKEVIHNAEEALQLHVDGMLEDGDKLPEPSELKPVISYKTPKDFCGSIVVPVRIPGPSRRVNITLREDLLKAIDQLASLGGTTRSGFLAQAALEEIRREKKTA